MKLWLDDVRPAPEGYLHVFMVEDAISEIVGHERQTDCIWRDYLLGHIDKEHFERMINAFTLAEISCDNDLGEGNHEGYKLLDWLEATGRNYPIHIHSANPVAVARMRAIIQKNGWREIL